MNHRDFLGQIPQSPDGDVILGYYCTCKSSVTYACEYCEEGKPWTEEWNMTRNYTGNGSSGDIGMGTNNKIPKKEELQELEQEARRQANQNLGKNIAEAESLFIYCHSEFGGSWPICTCDPIYK